jgi:hypothetical protein
VRPGAQVQVVGSDGHPNVIDHAQLGVDVDRSARLILEVIDRHAVPTRRAHDPEGLLLPDPVEGPGHRAVSIGMPWQHGDHPQLG